jgi:hypothetical protein
VKSILSSMRPVGWAALVGVAVLAFAGGAAASGPAFGIATLTSTPSGGAVPYSAAGAPTYVQYVTTFTRTSTDTSALTHSKVNEPVTRDANNNAVNADFPGTIVSLSSSPSCTPTYRDASTGVSCDFGTLRAGATVTLTVVVQMPTGTGTSSFSNLAALTVKEGGNDSQPQSNYTDTFFSNPLTTNLTSDPADAFNTWTLPGATGTFTYSTNKDAGTNNYQRSAVKWSGGSTFPGGQLQLAECGGPKADSPNCSAGTANPCGTVTCTTQTSIVLVPGSKTFFTQANPLTITLTFFASELGSGFKLSQFTLYHDGAVVSSCKKPLTDPQGDCVVSLLQDKSTGDVTAIITGPANGGWGGAG